MLGYSGATHTLGVLCPTCSRPMSMQGSAPSIEECAECRVADRWRQLPASVRNEIDGLLRRRNIIGSMQILRAQQAGLSLVGAQDIAEFRYGQLYDRGEVEPEPLVTVESILAKARTVTERIVVVEAHWDGDSRGWHLCLAAIVERPSLSHPRFDEVYLAILGAADAEDVAKGAAVASALGVPFHCVQPESPDLTIPRWWDGR